MGRKSDMEVTSQRAQQIPQRVRADVMRVVCLAEATASTLRASWQTERHVSRAPDEHDEPGAVEDVWIDLDDGWAQAGPGPTIS